MCGHAHYALGSGWRFEISDYLVGPAAIFIGNRTPSRCISNQYRLRALLARRSFPDEPICPARTRQCPPPPKTPRLQRLCGRRSDANPLHNAFDRLEQDHPRSPVVLTGTGARFSAGLDLGEHFPLFAGDPTQVASWFADYRATNMRLFTYPRPTVAAVNGHAFAGGLITAAVCDHRIAVADNDVKLGLNEVPIGIPMAAVYSRMLAFAWGEPVATRASLLGEIVNPTQAYTMGMVHELADADVLLDRAIEIAEQTPDDCLPQYAFTKRACQAAALRDIAELADQLDAALPTEMANDDARHAHRRYWSQLKGKEPPW
jgi:enoyl-CoA hydratase